jgi:hypothetical protein
VSGCVSLSYGLYARGFGACAFGGRRLRSRPLRRSLLLPSPRLGLASRRSIDPFLHLTVTLRENGFCLAVDLVHRVRRAPLDARRTRSSAQRQFFNVVGHGGSDSGGELGETHLVTRGAVALALERAEIALVPRGDQAPPIVTEQHEGVVVRAFVAERPWANPRLLRNGAGEVLEA